MKRKEIGAPVAAPRDECSENDGSLPALQEPVAPSLKIREISEIRG
jgi:hypothetical protein